MSKFDKNPYINNVALLRNITIHKQRKIFLENIIKEEKTSSSKSNPKPEMNKNKNSFPISVSTN